MPSTSWNLDPTAAAAAGTYAKQDYRFVIIEKICTYRSNVGMD